MARATKRTSVLLGALAAVFVIIIVILCIVPKAGSPGDETLTDPAKSRGRTDVLTDTSTASTTTTMTTTTTPAPAPPPPPETPTTTTSSPTTTPTPPPLTTTTTETPTTIATLPPTTPASSRPPLTTTETPTTVTSPTTTPTPPPSPLTTTAETPTTIAALPTTAPASSSPPLTATETPTTATSPTTTPTPPPLTTTAETPATITTLLTTTPAPPATTTNDTDSDDDLLFNDTTDDSTNVTTLSTTDDSTNVTTMSTTDDSTYVTILSTTDDSTNVTTLSTTDDDDKTTTNTTDTTVPSTTTPLPTTEPTTLTTTTLLAATTTSTEEVKKHCETPACKTLASNMLAAMDHTGKVDTCEDFYQYACGGLMQNPFLHARDPEVIARNLIKEELETADPDEDSALGKMRIFYDSCLDAVDQNATQGWKDAMQEVFGPDCLDWTSSSAVAPLNLTLILAKLINHDFTPFFDVDVDVDHFDNDKFIVTLSPALPDSPFSDDLARRACLEDHHRRLDNLEGGETVDLNEEYSVNFIECVRRGGGLEARMERMEEAVRTFGLLDHFGNSSRANEVLQDTKTKTEAFLKDLSHVSPMVATVKQKLLNQDAVRKNIGDLLVDEVNWEALVSQLISVNDISVVKVFEYMGDELIEILSKLQQHNTDSIALSRVLMMLWSERLYTDFVKPLGSGVGEPDYCLKAAVTLMPDAASQLYMNTLTNDEMDARKTQIKNITASIKRAGMRELQRKRRGNEEVKDKLEDMLDNVIMTSVKNVEAATTKSAEELNITKTDSFFENCIRLLVNKRRLRYNMYNSYPTDEPLRFMQPYDAFGVHVYALNRIMVPFAAQDDSHTFDTIPTYLSYAGIGHMISHLAMHGYDTSGLTFKANGERGVLDDQTHYTDLQKGLKDQYEANTTYDIAGSGGVKATVRMGTLALNELLADSGAARLAWEAYTMRNDPDTTEIPPSMATYNSQSSRRRRRHSPDVLPRRTRRAAQDLPSIDSEEETLPWLGLSPIQLYFLHWSQRYCSATGGMSLLELMESKQPPAKMRVNLVLQNEPLFSKAFNCAIPESDQKPFILG